MPEEEDVLLLLAWGKAFENLGKRFLLTLEPGKFPKLESTESHT